MRTELTVIIVLVMLASPTLATPGSAQRAPAPAGTTGTAAAGADTQPFTPALAGTWRAEENPVKLTSDFDRSVWGPDAASVRSTELVVEPSGEATLTVTRRVVDGQGRPVPASTSIETVQLVIGAARPGAATRMEHDVKVVSAERRYPDDPPSSWPLEGAGVRIVTFTDGGGDTLEVRVDTPEGRGSFWELLHRASRSSSNRVSR